MGSPHQLRDEDRTSDNETDGQDHRRYLCMKYNRYLEGDSIACQDADLYCKHRSSCLIHYLDKRRRREGCRKAKEEER